jgi:virginiamycin A acetyltransferase
MLKLKWWDLPVKEITKIIPLLHDNNIENVRTKLKEIVK